MSSICMYICQPPVNNQWASERIGLLCCSEWKRDATKETGFLLNPEV